MFGVHIWIVSTVTCSLCPRGIVVKFPLKQSKCSRQTVIKFPSTKNVHIPTVIVIYVFGCG